MEQIKIKYKTPVGLIIDENSHLKKGDESVKVARQYAGVEGKIDNCQVAVYCLVTYKEKPNYELMSVRNARIMFIGHLNAGQE